MVGVGQFSGGVDRVSLKKIRWGGDDVNFTEVPIWVYKQSCFNCS